MTLTALPWFKVNSGPGNWIKPHRTAWTEGKGWFLQNKSDTIIRRKRNGYGQETAKDHHATCHSQQVEDPG